MLYAKYTICCDAKRALSIVAMIEWSLISPVSVLVLPWTFFFITMDFLSSSHELWAGIPDVQFNVSFQFLSSAQRRVVA